ncbi:MAG: hypothetical protein Q9220_005472 [cf. Caloplaca sp. 1 TL-2023]
MPVHGRTRPPNYSHTQSAPNSLARGSFSVTTASTPDPGTPRALAGSDRPTQPPSSGSSEVDDGDADEADFHSHYSLGPQSESEDSSEAASELGDGDDEEINQQRPLLRHANSSFLSASAFAPPFYNKPPTPLPPSPSLTSLLRPSFSAATSRPTTPSSSENDTPNDTEAAVAKSARIATTVPRASPKVPTYEYYGFVLYLMSSMVFGMYILWSYLPSHFLHQLGIHYYPDRWWSLAIPSFLVMTLVYIYVALATYNTEYLTLPMSSIENIVDEAANIATVESQRNKKQNRSSEPKALIINPLESYYFRWTRANKAAMMEALPNVTQKVTYIRQKWEMKPEAPCIEPSKNVISEVLLKMGGGAVKKERLSLLSRK